LDFFIFLFMPVTSNPSVPVADFSTARQAGGWTMPNAKSRIENEQSTSFFILHSAFCMLHCFCGVSGLRFDPLSIRRWPTVTCASSISTGATGSCCRHRKVFGP